MLFRSSGHHSEVSVFSSLLQQLSGSPVCTLCAGTAWGDLAHCPGQELCLSILGTEAQSTRGHNKHRAVS